MAYCVHCGVKLHEGEKRCPLCGTVSIDPNEQPASDPGRTYPVRTPEQDLKRGKQFFLVLEAVLLLVPAGLCCLIDLLTGGGIHWSIYTLATLVSLFLVSAVPVLVPKYRTYSTIGIGFVVLSGYLLFIEHISGTSGWCLPVVIPSLALAAAMLTVILALWRGGRLNKVTLLGAGFAAVAVECLAIEWLLSRSLTGRMALAWSPYAVAPCLFIAVVLFFINGNRSIREEVRRRLHF
ncbi:MAG: DUF6320 domain-containing protein [Eubacteriales bacterium]|nr:DUF6320 domain-containing protein [Eubacteriales bacterium]